MIMIDRINDRLYQIVRCSLSVKIGLVDRSDQWTIIWNPSAQIRTQLEGAINHLLFEIRLKQNKV